MGSVSEKDKWQGPKNFMMWPWSGPRRVMWYVAQVGRWRHSLIAVPMNNQQPVFPNISIHNVNLNGFSTVWVCSWFLSGLISRISCHTLNISKASLLCGSSHVSSSRLILRSFCHTLSTWMAFLLCGSSHGSSSELVRNSCHTYCIEIASLMYGFSSGIQTKLRSSGT